MQGASGLSSGRNLVDGKEYLGGSYVMSEAPLEAIPVFERV